MKRHAPRVIAAGLAAVLVLSACGDDDADTSGDESAIDAPDDAEQLLSDVQAEFTDLPLPVDEFSDRATELGYTTRPVIEDGEALAVTMDLRLDRINVEVADGQVVDIVSIG